MHAAAIVAVILTGCLPPEPGARYRVAAMMFETGAFTRDVPARFPKLPEPVVPCTDASCSAEKRAPAPVALEPPSTDLASAIGGAWRMAVIIKRHVLVGGDLEIGGVRSSASDYATTDSAINLGASAFIGVTERIGRLSASAELAYGVQRIMRRSDDDLWFFKDDRAFLEPRVRLDIWISSHLTLGAYAIVDEGGAHVGGIRLSGSLPSRRQR